MDSETLKFKLFTRALKSGIAVRLEVTGTSMLPSIWPGDILAIERADAAGVAPGDVLVLLREGQLVIHRMVEFVRRFEESYIVARGDAIPQDDPPVHPSYLLGKVSTIERGHRRIVLNRRIAPVSRLFGLTLAHFDCLRSLTLRLNSARRREHREVAPRVALPPSI